MRLLLCLLVVMTLPSLCVAWSPCVQGVIGLAAVEGLSSDERASFLNLLRHHPQYEEMIAPQEGSDPELRDEITIVRASTWADRVAGTKYDRPSWHFYPGLCRWPMERVVPLPPFELPDDARAKPHDLNLLQAVKLCHQMLNDASAPESDRAVALCWLISLIAKQNQPLRLYSLQVSPIFADGDDHGRKIFLGEKTIFASVEEYFSGSDDIAEVMSLKEQLELSDQWESNISFFADFGAFGATDADTCLVFAAGNVYDCYRNVQHRVTLALIAGKSAPLKFSVAANDYHVSTIARLWIPTELGRASGQLRGVLSEAM